MIGVCNKHLWPLRSQNRQPEPVGRWFLALLTYARTSKWRHRIRGCRCSDHEDSSPSYFFHIQVDAFVPLSILSLLHQEHFQHNTNMTPLQAWFDTQTAPTPEAMLAGDGCHPDEARALDDYLNNSISAEETAKRITTPILNEIDPPEQLYRLWGLLSDGMAELSPNNRLIIVALLSHIQSLPPAPGIQWADLPGFGSMWDTLNRLHLHGPDSWERSVGSFGREEVDELRRTFAAVGHAEAEMFLRGTVPAGWGYEVLNLACSGRAGLDIFVSEIFAWLETAGEKLKEEKGRSENTALRFTRPVPNSPTRENMAIEAILAGHWLEWKEALLRLSREESELSDESRRIAGRCHGLM